MPIVTGRIRSWVLNNGCFTFDCRTLDTLRWKRCSQSRRDGFTLGRKQFRQSEVEHPQPAIPTHHHVLGFQITVENSVSMRLGQRLGNCQTNAHDFLGSQSLLVHALPQRLSLDELQRQVRVAIVFANAVHGNDVWMIEAGSDTGLFEKPINCFAVCGKAPATNHFERYPTAQLGVASEVDFAHAASTEELQHTVVVDHAIRLKQRILGRHPHRWSPAKLPIGFYPSAGFDGDVSATGACASPILGMARMRDCSSYFATAT
ncbi:MAG: hypothetical protein V2A73_09005 [Pseudomonadota bacterium]